MVGLYIHLYFLIPVYLMLFLDESFAFKKVLKVKLNLTR